MPSSNGLWRLLVTVPRPKKMGMGGFGMAANGNRSKGQIGVTPRGRIAASQRGWTILWSR